MWSNIMALKLYYFVIHKHDLWVPSGSFPSPLKVKMTIPIIPCFFTASSYAFVIVLNMQPPVVKMTHCTFNKTFIFNAPPLKEHWIDLFLNNYHTIIFLTDNNHFLSPRTVRRTLKNGLTAEEAQALGLASGSEMQVWDRRQPLRVSANSLTHIIWIKTLRIVCFDLDLADACFWMFHDGYRHGRLILTDERDYNH